MKRIIAFLLCVMMVVSVCPVSAFAAADAPNVTWEFRAGTTGSTKLDLNEALEPGTEFRVLLKCEDMNVSSIAAGFDFDTNVFEVTKISTPTLQYWGIVVEYDEEADEDVEVEGWVSMPATTVSTKAEANASGHIGVVFAGAKEEQYKAKTICTVTMKVKDDANGNTNIFFFEDSAGSDGFKSEGSASAEEDLKQDMTIAPSTPACEHTTTKLVTNNNGTHNVVCADVACGAVVTENVPCTGTDDGDHTTAVVCACGYTVTAGTAHTDANPKDHVCDVAGCDHAMGEHKSNAQYACQDGTCTYCGKPVAASANHTDGDDKNHNCDVCNEPNIEGHTEGDPVKNDAESKDATCTEGGTIVTETFCTECGAKLNRTETPVAATCTTGTASYTWGAGNAACKAQLKCEHGTVLKEEEVNTTSSVTTKADCQTAEVVTYTADFAADWAEDQSKSVTGEKNPDKHVGDATVSYKYVGDNKHTQVSTYKCDHAVDGATTACFDGSDADELCDACENNLHVHAHDHYEINTESHSSVCSCGVSLNPVPVDHKIGENNRCVCGAFLFTVDYNGGADSENPGEDSYSQYVTQHRIDWNDDACKATYTKEGYVFAGFAYDAAGENPVQKGTTFTSPTTLYVVWEAKEYTLNVRVLATGESVELTVPYGANLLEVLAKAEAEGKIPAMDSYVAVNVEGERIGKNKISGYSYLVSVESGFAGVTESFTMPAGDFEVDQVAEFIGWNFESSVGAEYCDEDDGWLNSGWHYIEENFDNVEGGAWYYFYEGTGEWENCFFRVEGMTRVPYPTEEINGNTYAPDAEAMAYAESKGETFIDATEAWFSFDQDGKFNFIVNGFTTYGENNKYNGKMTNGMLTWHPGMVEVAPSVYRYFTGNTEIGGNTVANGDTYITRSQVAGFNVGDIYHFTDGALSGRNGVVDGKYYENSRLMVANGLTKVGDKYIYVRSNGYIVVNADYYVPANDKGIVSGTYRFDENGYLVNPEQTSKNGIVSENGGLYFYENGKIAYNKGLVEFEGNVIYVRSNGQLAVGAYYVTNLTNYTGTAVKYGDKVTFGADGCMVAAKNGVVEGKYYVNNQIAYGAGVVEIEEGKYIYVKSNGTVVKGVSYWITNVGDTGVVAKSYTFDENGYFTPEFAADQKSGIVDGYYYQNGKIVYGAGLTAYNDGYIYVRSNGMVATGKYWVTNTNGLLESNYYTFGDDGMMITE